MNPADDKQQTATTGGRQPVSAAESGTGLGLRARNIALWARDTGLGITGFIVVLIVALAGWSASFIGLHQFGMTHMGLTNNQAWLVPVTFDGAAGGLSLVVFRASINGRSAALWRLLIVVFTVLSSWINWVHIDDVSGRWIACYMPPSAVILFEGLMSEARAAYARRGGKERPRVHPLRWVFDRRGTKAIYRSYILGIELPEHLQQQPLTATKTPSDAATEAPVAAPQSAAPERHEQAIQSAPVADLERHEASSRSATEAPQADATKAPRERSETTPQSATTTPRKAPSKRHGKGTRGAAKDAIEALYEELGRRPLESEMVAALIKAKSPHTSRQFANKLRAEIEKEDPKLAALGSDNVRPLTGT